MAEFTDHPDIVKITRGRVSSAADAIVEPIHPKAMPVILITDKERDVGCVCHGMKRRRPLRHDAAKIAARGADREDRSADG